LQRSGQRQGGRPRQDNNGGRTRTKQDHGSARPSSGRRDHTAPKTPEGQQRRAPRRTSRTSHGER
jgi:hypothetical protein